MVLQPVSTRSSPQVQSVGRRSGVQYSMGSSGTSRCIEALVNWVPTQHCSESEVRQCGRFENASQPHVPVGHYGNHCKRGGTGRGSWKLSTARTGAHTRSYQCSSGRVEPPLGSAPARFSFSRGRGKRPTPITRRQLLESRLRKIAQPRRSQPGCQCEGLPNPDNRSAAAWSSSRA